MQIKIRVDVVDYEMHRDEDVINKTVRRMLENIGFTVKSVSIEV